MEVAGSPPRTAGTNISQEFLRQKARGLEPVCARPWRVLKITLNARTKICCDFFTLLPEFDFPTARDFHKSTGMWNHPFMQHMRRTMGTDNEVPFCTLCLSADKRSPEHLEWRNQAKADSLALYRQFDAEARRHKLKGSLESLPEDLSGYQLDIGGGRSLKPFTKSRAFYRRSVLANGFFGRARVLLFGCGSPTMAPFLAEASGQLTIADVSAASLRRAERLCRMFDLPVDPQILRPGQGIGAESDSYDGIWISGAMLSATNISDLLPEMRRLLAPSGTLHVHLAPAVGQFLRALASETKQEERQPLLALLRHGFAMQDRIRFVSRRDLRQLLRRHGLRLDISLPQSIIWDPDVQMPSLDDNRDAEVFQRRYLASDAQDDSRGKVERFVSFSAHKWLGPAAKPFWEVA